MGKKTTGKRGQERDISKNDESNSSEEVINNKISHGVSDNDVEFGVTQTEVVAEGDVDVNRKEEEKKRDEIGGDDADLRASDNEVEMTDGVDENEKKRNEVGGHGDGLSASRIESVVVSNVGEDKRKKEKNGKKRHGVGNDFEFGDGRNEVVIEGDVDIDITENENDRKRKRKKKKRKLEINEDEHETLKAKKKDKGINNDREITEDNEASKQKHLELEENANLQKNVQEDSGNNSEFEVRKKSKKRHMEDMNDEGTVNISSLDDITEDVAETMNRKNNLQKKKKNKQHKGINRGGDGTRINNGTNGEAGREREQLDRNMMEEVENGRKKKKRKKKGHNDSQAEKLQNVNIGVEDMEGHAVLDEDGKKDKKNKPNSVKNASSGDKKASRAQRSVEPNDPCEDSARKEISNKKVRFSDQVQVYPSSDVKKPKDDGFVRGKRFSKEEDEMIKRAVVNYIETHRLGEEGLNMVLHCKSHPEVKHCWKEIGAALPRRPYDSIYYRAHIIFQRDKNRKWTPEELEFVLKFHEKHGSNWKMLADALGKHRFHVKDAWRRVRLPNQKKGQWSQEEYQKLFHLVNMDLRMKALEEKKTKHGMLRDNISWEAISDKLATRSNALCCMKWYDQLTSPMVAEGKWSDTDDFHLVNALSSLDACCMDDVDWDNLLEHRSGTFCRKRWNQMVKHLGTDGNESFPEQVEILSTRYCPDVLEAREAYSSKPAVD